jgi:hypothetical protein
MKSKARTGKRRRDINMDACACFRPTGSQGPASRGSFLRSRSEPFKSVTHVSNGPKPAWQPNLPNLAARRLALSAKETNHLCLLDSPFFLAAPSTAAAFNRLPTWHPGRCGSAQNSPDAAPAAYIFCLSTGRMGPLASPSGSLGMATTRNGTDRGRGSPVLATRTRSRLASPVSIELPMDDAPRKVLYLFSPATAGPVAASFFRISCLLDRFFFLMLGSRCCN